ncbi:MAG: 50S ribosomal protein L15 [Armatimonadetes bacterium]|nr:50S ribosomal protein L15 [Armatimonadota bacterium]
MKLTDLKPARGSRKEAKRLGRGHGSGWVKTCGKGSKGQKSRSGGVKGPGFEGGQTPWQRRLPKLCGFKNMNKVRFQVVGLASLCQFEPGKEVTCEDLVEAGLVKDPSGPVKILANGDIDRPLTVKVHGFSKAAEEKIAQAGGKAEVI